jgi:hypothetical protein
VPPCAAALTIAGNDESPLVLTVFKLLSTAFAAAVFLFASARSRSSMVSCVALAASAVFFSFPQARLPARRRTGTAIENLGSVFIDLPEVDRIRLVGQRPCHTGSAGDAVDESLIQISGSARPCPHADGEKMEQDQPELNTVIRTFANEIEAHVAQAVLDANGIDSGLIRDDANGMMPWLQWLHPIRLVVREEDSGDAVELLDTPPGPTLSP